MSETAKLHHKLDHIIELLESLVKSTRRIEPCGACSGLGYCTSFGNNYTCTTCNGSGKRGTA